MEELVEETRVRDEERRKNEAAIMAPSIPRVEGLESGLIWAGFSISPGTSATADAKAAPADVAARYQAELDGL